MQWNLEKLYETSVQGVKVPKLDRLKILGEDVALYRKDGENYTPVGNVDNDYYNNTLSKYIKLGSSDSKELRKTVSKILTKNNGNTPNNLDIFQSYVVEGGFTLDDQTLAAGESFTLSCISKNAGITLDEFMKNIYGNVDVYNQHFRAAWVAEPPTTRTMARPGAAELFLAFFCNGTKPEKGDLLVGEEKIEVKGLQGRLFSGDRIEIKKAQRELANKYIEDETELFKEISITIGALAGNHHYSSDILKLIMQPELKTQIVSDYNYLKKKGGLPNLSLTMKVAGVVQLLAYKEAQGFDSMIAFNHKLSEGVWLQFINFKKINNLASLYSIIQDLPSRVHTSARADGSGFSLSVFPK